METIQKSHGDCIWEEGSPGKLQGTGPVLFLNLGSGSQGCSLYLNSLSCIGSVNFWSQAGQVQILAASPSS